MSGPYALPVTTNPHELLIQGVVAAPDPSGHVVSWNPRAEKIKGYTAEEIIGQQATAENTR
jgi:PAS domain-containing protein